MIESLKALFIVFTMSLGAFVFARLAFSQTIDGRIIDRWRNVYLAVTVAAFMIPNFWFMLFIVALLVILLGATSREKPPLYLLLLFAIPAADALVPGFGGIRNFLNLYPFNILAVIILFPLLFAPQENRRFHVNGALADYCFILFSILSLVLAFRDTTITDGFRRATAYILTAFGPYLVFSRYNWTPERLKIGTLAYAIPLIALSGVAVAETVLHWHVYKNPVDMWGINFFSRYMARSGFLRAYGSVFGPITFGLFLVVGLALMAAVVTTAKRRLLPAVAFCALGVGLITTFSRGPWVGAALAIVAFAMTTGKPMGNLVRLAMIGCVAFPIIAVSPIGDELINMLPFVGEVDSGTIDYRQRLFEVAWPYAMTHPWFGSEGYLTAPEMQSLVQGQGIIDIVNSYLQVALDKGLVGLALFVGVSGFSLFSVYRAISKARRFDADYAAYVQAWFAALVGFMLTIATTTNVIAQIAEVHWLLCGISVGIARSVAAAAAGAEFSAPPGSEPPADDPPPAPRRHHASPYAPPVPKHLRQYVKR
jgi:O-antigen ligase